MFGITFFFKKMADNTNIWNKKELHLVNRILWLRGMFYLKKSVKDSFSFIREVKPGKKKFAVEEAIAQLVFMQECVLHNFK